MNKNQNFLNRLRYAISGLRAVFKKEASLRTQVFALIALIVVCLFLRPSAIWCALFTAMSCLVIALEIINSAVEAVLDRIFPEYDEMVRFVKDAMAGAVLVVSFGAFLVFAFYLFTISRFAG